MSVAHLPVPTVAELLGVTATEAEAWLAGRTRVPRLSSAFLRMAHAGARSDRAISVAAAFAAEPPLIGSAVYGFEFDGPFGACTGALVVDSGLISGTDEHGCRYSGRYLHYDALGKVMVHVRVYVPLDATFVLPVDPCERPQEFDVVTILPDRLTETTVPINTAFGEVSVRLTRLIGLESALPT